MKCNTNGGRHRGLVIKTSKKNWGNIAEALLNYPYLVQEKTFNAIEM